MSHESDFSQDPLETQSLVSQAVESENSKATSRTPKGSPGEFPDNFRPESTLTAASVRPAFSNEDVDTGYGDALFVEIFRISVVVLAAVVTFVLTVENRYDNSIASLIVALAILIGYVIGGVAGRFISNTRSNVEERLETISTPTLFMAGVGLIIGMVVSLALAVPLFFLGFQPVSVAVSLVLIVVGGYFGLNIGAHRSGDLMRFLGAGGRRPTTVNVPRGIEYKLLDTSALVDGRIVDLCANGFVEGELLVPTFIVDELQGLADSQDKERRRRGQRGLDVLSDLQHLTTIGVQITQENPLPTEVDAKLLYLAKKRGTPLFTTDANLARVAEIQNIPVRNINRLADSVRPPVTAGDVLTVRIARAGREDNQGVGFLADGSMVVVENAETEIGNEIDIYVTSLMANNSGRMIFATYSPQQFSD